MNTLRDIKARSRSRLHERMKVETLCYTDGPSGPSETVWLRVHSEIEKKGDLAGTSLAYAERLDDNPKLVFLAADHTPKKKNVYIVSDVEGYRIDSLEPQDGITIKAVAVRLKAEEVSNYAAPGD